MKDEETISVVKTLIIPILLIIGVGAVLLASLVFFTQPINEPDGSTPTPVPTAAATTAAVTTVATAPPTVVGPSPAPTSVGTFSVSVSPRSATARPGDVVTYTMRVDADPGYLRDVRLSLRVTAPFYDQTYDLGTVSPPYPRILEYPFEVPGYVPPFVTISGTLTATDGSVTRQETLTLSVT